MIVTMQAQPDVKRVAPIVMGRKDYLSVLFRLIGMDLYKVRRRLLSKVLLLVGTLVIAFVFFAIGIAAWHLASQPATSFVPANCAVLPHNVGCINHPVTLADMQHEKQRILDGAAQLLNIPGVWNVKERFVIQVLWGLGIGLAGGLVGVLRGRGGLSTVGGRLGLVGWLWFWPGVGNIFAVLTRNVSGGLSDFVKAIPDYFFGNNLSSLLHNQGHALSFSEPGPYADGHSLLVIAVYLIVFAGVAGFLPVPPGVTHEAFSHRPRRPPPHTW